MKHKVNVVKYEEPEDDNQEWQALFDLIKKQAVLDEKLQLLIVAVVAPGE